MDIPSTQPYLLRAIYDWCCDNAFTPYLQVAVDSATRVPPAYVQGGQVTLNIGPEATQNLKIGNEEISFVARFGGVPAAISVPVARVMAIYARENGAGMGFQVEDAILDDLKGKTEIAIAESAAEKDEGRVGRDSPGAGSGPSRQARKPGLKRVK